MKTYAGLHNKEVQYTVRSKDARCCGACEFLQVGTNTITCSRIDPPARVMPQGVCKLFKMLGEKDDE